MIRFLAAYVVGGVDPDGNPFSQSSVTEISPSNGVLSWPVVVTPLVDFTSEILSNISRDKSGRIQGIVRRQAANKGN